MQMLEVAVQRFERNEQRWEQGHFLCRVARQVLNPAYDCIPPNLVDLYITNMGGLQPSYIYRLLAEYYHRDDLIISP
ncbi:unnamed protein product [Ectocarpus sp. CCAP 1310/34]|nr:unnamed protein product [Ectocarpus sp. CCAP 1310/34]